MQGGGGGAPYMILGPPALSKTLDLLTMLMKCSVNTYASVNGSLQI